MLITCEKFCCGPFAQKRRRLALLAAEIEQMRDHAGPEGNLAKALREREIIGKWLLCHTCTPRPGTKAGPTRVT